MKRISTRFALMMAAAAVVPLLAYGAVSILSVRAGAQRLVKQGNQDVARRVGEQIEAYVIDNVRTYSDSSRTERITCRWNPVPFP
jgi:hypothetical protein